MKIEVQWPFGNFRITAACNMEFAEPVSPLTLAICRKGFLQLLQRVPASNAEKALAGYEKRPAGFKRDSIPFSEENALKLSEAFGTSVEVEESVELAFTVVDVVEHEGGEGATSRKMATEMAEKVKGTPMLVSLGLSPDESDDNVIIEACHKFLASLRKAPVKKG